MNNIQLIMSIMTQSDVKGRCQNQQRGQITILFVPFVIVVI